MRKFTLLMAVLGLMFNTTAQDLPDNLKDSLILYYSFNKIDLFGDYINTKDTVNKFGKRDSSLYFLGNSNVNLKDTIELDSSDFTISVWFYADSILDGYGSKILNKGLTVSGTPKNTGYGLRLQKGESANYLKFMLGDEFGNITYLQDSIISTKTWYNISVTKEDLVIKLYVDGILKDYKTLENNVNVTTNMPLSIGALDRGGYQNIDEYFYGFIDELRIYNRSLSNGELKELQSLFNGNNSCTDTVEIIIYDTLKVYDTIVTEVFDTSIIQLYHVDTIITEIFDTSEVLLSDTNIITLYSIDTLTVEVFDTLSTYDTILVVEGDTQVVTLYNIDTLTTEVFDTVSVTETVTYTIFDTISVMDTTTTVLYQIDTQVVTINDTNEVMIDVYDTTYVSVDDTLVITMSSDTSTGIDFLTAKVNVYPNPASTQLNVEIDMSGNYTVSLTNISGQMVFTQANVMSNIQIDISEFTQGLYFITITDNDGVLKAEERKIVIE